MENNKYQIVLIRHGFSLANQLKSLSGQSDVPLLEKGRKELVEYRNKYNYIDTDIFYSSDLMRCTSTFDALYGPKRKLDGTFKELREIHFYEKENNFFEDRTKLAKMFDLWLDDDPSTRDIESFDNIKDRMTKMFYKTLDDLKTSNKKSATIVTHSCAMKCMLIGIGAFSKDQFREIITNNGQGFVLNVDYSNKLKINECVNLFDYIK